MRISDWSSDVCSSDLEAQAAMMGFFARQTLGRPYVTLKLATSLDGQIARADGESQWITGPQARAHTHLERARHDAILVGHGTVETDKPRLNVRLAGLEGRSPHRVMLGGSEEHTSELQSLMRSSYAVFCLTKITYSPHLIQTTL